MKYELGSEVSDKVTGYAGKITARADYLSESPRYQVEALVNGEPKALWIDESRVVPK